VVQTAEQADVGAKDDIDARVATFILFEYVRRCVRRAIVTNVYRQVGIVLSGQAVQLLAEIACPIVRG